MAGWLAGMTLHFKKNIHNIMSIVKLNRYSMIKIKIIYFNQLCIEMSEEQIHFLSPRAFIIRPNRICINLGLFHNIFQSLASFQSYFKAPFVFSCGLCVNLKILNMIFRKKIMSIFHHFVWIIFSRFFDHFIFMVNSKNC